MSQIKIGAYLNFIKRNWGFDSMEVSLEIKCVKVSEARCRLNIMKIGINVKY